MAAKNNAQQKQNKKPVKQNKKEKGEDSSLKFYLKNVRSELKRVVWPTKSEVINYSLVVVATLIFFGVLIYIVDTLIIPVFVAFAGLR